MARIKNLLKIIKAFHFENKKLIRFFGNTKEKNHFLDEKTIRILEIKIS